jgi:thymidylate kinase
MASEYHFLSSRAQADEVVVFDEGFVHRAVHMFVSASEQLNAHQIIEYLKWLPRSDVVIWVKSPLDTCLARIHARGLQVRLSDLTTEGIARFVANAEQVVNIASQYLRDTGWSVVEITNDGDLGKCAAEMHHSVEPYLFQMASAVGEVC